MQNFHYLKHAHFDNKKEFILKHKDIMLNHSPERAKIQELYQQKNDFEASNIYQRALMLNNMKSVCTLEGKMAEIDK